ncbi:MAG: cell wall-binding repeat-containing protein [Clostridia bacterium]|nr:cell wall-binding repeat-containing protein [Clostridia bacterium]
MKNLIRSTAAVLAVLILALSCVTAVGAENLGLSAQTGPYFTARAVNSNQVNAVYSQVKKRTTAETSQKIYNLLFKATYRPTDIGGKKWIKGNSGNGITSCTDSGLGKTVHWPSVAWGCCSYAYFASVYSRANVGTKLYLGYGSKPSASQVKSFFASYADPGEHVRFYYSYSGYSSVHSIIYLTQDDNGFYFLSEDGSNLVIRLYYCTFSHFSNILRSRSGDYSLWIYDTNNKGKDPVPVTVTANLSVNTDVILAGENVTLKMSGQNTGIYDVKIYKGSSLVESTTVNASNYVFKCTAPGEYSASVTAYADKAKSASAQSSKASWQVYDADLSRVSRIAGTSRIDTAIRISNELQNALTSSGSGQKTVIISNAYSFADALAGSTLAYALDAPILLTANNGDLEGDVKKQIVALGTKKIIILGGKSAVSDSIEKKLISCGYSVERLSGTNRFQTAVAIAEKLAEVTGTSPKEVFVTCAYNYPDALAASSVAAINGSPIFFADADGKIDPVTLGYIKSSQPEKAVILGGEMAVGESAEGILLDSGIKNVTRISGNTRYDTAFKIVSGYSSIFEGGDVVLATGTAFPDALAGGVFAAKIGAPIILADSTGASEETLNYIGSKTGMVYVLGGVQAVTHKTLYCYIQK